MAGWCPRPPERGEDADEDEGGQDIFSGPDPLSGHTQHLRKRKALSDGVQGKNDISQQQGEQGCQQPHGKANQQPVSGENAAYQPGGQPETGNRMPGIVAKNAAPFSSSGS